MKVSHFCTFPYGGAAAAAMRNHKQLRKLGVDSHFYYHRNDRAEPFDGSVHQIELVPPQTGWAPRFFRRKKLKQRNREIYQLFDRHLAHRDSQSETFSMARLPDPSRLAPDAVNVDVIHLHWLAFFADYPSFFQSIPRHVPVVWTLHDMNAFTGGCHYSSGCRKFTVGCGNCPQIENPLPDDVSDDSFAVKREALCGRQIHVTAPSQWMLDLAQRSSIWPTSTTFEKIYLGINSDDFFPEEKMAARRELGIETDAVLIGFGADDLSSHRKGFHHLLSALQKIKSESEVECLVFGAGEIPSSPGFPKMHPQGFVDSVNRQRLIYGASDLVVIPSREDNQPQVGLEAMACGTPVVAFDAGGIPEYVRHGETGCVVRMGDEGKLAEAIAGLVDSKARRQRMGTMASKMIADEFELNQQTEAYRRLYARVAMSNGIYEDPYEAPERSTASGMQSCRKTA